MKFFAKGITLLALCCTFACVENENYDPRIDAGDVVDCVRSNECPAPLQCISFVCQMPVDAGPEDTVVDATGMDRESNDRFVADTATTDIQEAEDVL